MVMLNCVFRIVLKGVKIKLYGYVKYDICFVFRIVLKGVKSNGYSFNGKGYVILDRGDVNFRPNYKAEIMLDFKTYAENGLIMYLGKLRDFLSLELRDGKVLFQYDLGSTPARIMTNGTYNDGQWHRISARRNRKDGLLVIEEESKLSID